ncbi:MAG TPA: hypothetical protein VN752_12910 [Solirubrobacterales bacterium]|nr:hypothetical protein [Solirubrobacterales bacterium]
MDARKLPTLADLVLSEAVTFLRVFEEMKDGRVTLDQIDERIDALGLEIQAIDVARSNPQSWEEHVPRPISAYEHLWPCEQILLFLLANHAAFHASLGRGIDGPFMSPESIAGEVLSLDWLIRDAENRELLDVFLAHPAVQAMRA